MSWRFPTPFCLLVRVVVRRERYALFKDLARKVAFAYQQHESRMAWSAYATVAGPSLSVFVLIPLDGLSDLDMMPSLERVMFDVYGTEGDAKLRAFQNCVLDMDSSLLTRTEPGRGPAASGDPAEFMLHTVMTVAPSAAARFHQCARRLAALDPDHPFDLYAAFAGVARLHSFAMGSKIADFEGLARRLTGATAGHDRSEASQLLAEVQETLLASETSILNHIGHQTR